MPRRRNVSGEIVAIVSVGIALAGLILNSNRVLRHDITLLRAEFRQDLARTEERQRDDITHLSDRVGRLEHGQAKLEGLLDGLREAITGRAST